MRQGKFKPLFALLLVLVAVGGFGGYTWWNEYQKQAKVDTTFERQRIGSTLLRAAGRIQNDTGEWPKDISEMHDDGEVLDLGENALDGIQYNLVSVSDSGVATYEYTYKDRKVSVDITPLSSRPSTPNTATPQAG
ncbi:MAG: hypothetical protein ACK4XJ_01140 [Fimbriimonadaceae bacterium]